MSQHDLKRTSRSSYLHDEEGLWDENPVGAKYRIESNYVETVSPRPANKFYVMNSSGEWDLIQDKDQIPEKARGLQWNVWGTSVAGERYAALRGLRVIDDELLSLFDNLKTLHPNGIAPDSPLELGHEFLLGPIDFNTFQERVVSLGGSIVQGGPAIEELHSALSECKHARNEIEALLKRDRDTINKFRDQDFSDLPEFDYRWEEYHRFLATASAARKEADMAINILIASGAGSAEIDAAQDTYKVICEEVRAARLLIEQREILQREIVTNRSRTKNSSIPSAVRSERELLIAEIARYAADFDLDVTTDENRTVVEVGGASITFDPDLGIDVTNKVFADDHKTSPET